MIFVFGSNLKGIHGAGAALHAVKFYGAQKGIGEGWWGNSYALPTCSEPGVPLPLSEIKNHVDTFLDWAHRRWELTAYAGQIIVVTRIGCGYAGYNDNQIAPMFRQSPDNVWLPARWVNMVHQEGFNEGYKTGIITCQAILKEERDKL